MTTDTTKWGLLQGLRPDEEERVRALGEVIRVPSGTGLFALGEPATKLYIVESGRIGLSMPLQIRGDERDVLVSEMLPGEMVGWSAMVAPHRFTLTAKATVDSLVVAISREGLSALFEQEPRVGAVILGNVASAMAKRLQKVQAMWLREIQRTVNSKFGGGVVGAVVALFLAVSTLMVGCGDAHRGGRFPAAALTAEATPVPEAPGAHVEVPPPPFSDGIYPCSDCHADMEPNKTRRQLTDEHTNIVLEHDAEHRWCLDCHDADNRDKLHLASGELVGFEESYRLCGQCHGPKYRDWKVGIHGRRTGYWNGQKKYLLCAHCHNPHSPHFKPLAPKPAPDKPQRS